MHSAVCRYFPYSTKRGWDAAKRDAGKQVYRALKSGALVRKPCERCGRKAEAHHEDYSKPLCVNWLCRKHHRARHYELQQGHAEALAVQSVEPLPTRVYRKLIGNPELSSPLILEVTLAISIAMTQEGLSENQLANRIGSSRQHVNSMFHGGVRTLKAVASIADALGYDVRMTLVKRAHSVAKDAA